MRRILNGLLWGLLIGGFVLGYAIQGWSGVARWGMIVLLAFFDVYGDPEPEVQPK